jgi:hypothetical protein
MGGIPVVTVSNDPFGRAIKSTLEFMQKSKSDCFKLAQLPPVGADLIAQVRSGRLFAFTHATEAGQADQAKRAIVTQLENARLIEIGGGPLEYEYRLTEQGRKTLVDLKR